MTLRDDATAVLLDWARIELMHLLLSNDAAKAVVWLDADVLVLGRDPFHHWLNGTAAMNADVIHQPEMSLLTSGKVGAALGRNRFVYGSDASLSDIFALGDHLANFNTGFFIIRSAALARAMLLARLRVDLAPHLDFIITS